MRGAGGPGGGGARSSFVKFEDDYIALNVSRVIFYISPIFKCTIRTSWHRVCVTSLTWHHVTKRINNIIIFKLHLNNRLVYYYPCVVATLQSKIKIR